MVVRITEEITTTAGTITGVATATGTTCEVDEVTNGVDSEVVIGGTKSPSG